MFGILVAHDSRELSEFFHGLKPRAEKDAKFFREEHEDEWISQDIAMVRAMRLHSHRL